MERLKRDIFMPLGRILNGSKITLTELWAEIKKIRK